MKSLLAGFVMLSQTVALAGTLPDDVPRLRWSPNPLYIEEGFRYGHILKFAAVLGWRFEGSLMIGDASSPGTLMDQECVNQETAAANTLKSAASKELALRRVHDNCLIDETPWDFSSLDSDTYQKYKANSDSPVVIYYVRPAPSVSPLEMLSIRALWTYTPNFVMRLWTAGEYALSTPSRYSIAKGELAEATHINPAEGFTEGRIVKATLDHLLRKTYEVTIQQAGAGSDFVRMSVDDSGMFDHLVVAMLSGHRLRIGYVRLFAWVEGWLSELRGYSTLYRITSVEILPPTSGEEAP